MPRVCTARLASRPPTTYPAQGTAARCGATGPIPGRTWLFGGAGYDSNGVYDAYGLNDLWELVTD